MKILHVNTYDCMGGAARAAYRLHDGLCRLGQQSRMFVAHKMSDDPSVIDYTAPDDVRSRSLRILRRARIALASEVYHFKAPAGLASFSDDRAKYGKHPWQHLPNSDLIQLHWVAWFLDYREFFELVPPTTPIVWTLHDMVPFTGGCHYDEGCRRFIGACGRCPQLGSASDADLTRQVWQRKRQSFQKLRPEKLHIVTPSRWLGEQVGQSSLLSRFPRSVIPYGLDTDVFAPRDRSESRKLLRIPLDAKVILFIAQRVDEPRKGFHLLSHALRSIESTPGLFLISLGSGVPQGLQGIPNVHIPDMRNDRLLSHIYSAADILVVPSLQDNLPNTVLESISCGTPVVGFAVGGIPDMVRPGLTGLLAAPGDAEDLQRAIIDLLKDDQDRKEMAIHCRQIAKLEYALEVQAKRYVDLYEDVLGARPRDGWQTSAKVAKWSPEANVACSSAGLLEHSGEGS